ncbi:putative translation initiation factor [Ascobolus immersus RN42]|uniref:Methylthioribose-1-phosphate isomerase n=1 Tax=Ascobolus immersus RN42 TaxID=1160509 RepID=A0A3N4IKW8_ASCIM|nr:putative translation initiation factor [Ascobolus immersus RN42]
MTDAASKLKAIDYTRGSLRILDQLLLPHQTVYLDITNSEQAWSAIRTMQTRGAPAIAIVAVLALAVDLHTTASTFTTSTSVRDYINTKLDYLVTSRPTAVNLADAVQKLKTIIDASPSTTSASDLINLYITSAESLLASDITDNTSIGSHGSGWLLSQLSGRPATVLTHCNTGSLATAGYGTALGIIRSLHSSGNLTHAYCTETRPYNQGSRLTAYELVQEGMPATLITDSMVTSLLTDVNVKNKPDAIIVGADRVARNGDTANKIGTHQLAILARHFGIKFIVAAPTTTIDLDTKEGADIVIEQRPAEEVKIVKGLLVGGEGELAEVVVAPKEIGVYNPSFDVTPWKYIDAVVTEKGVVERGENGFDFSGVFVKQ